MKEDTSGPCCAKCKSYTVKNSGPTGICGVYNSKQYALDKACKHFTGAPTPNEILAKARAGMREYLTQRSTEQERNK